MRLRAPMLQNAPTWASAAIVALGWMSAEGWMHGSRMRELREQSGQLANALRIAGHSACRNGHCVVGAHGPPRWHVSGKRTEVNGIGQEGSWPARRRPAADANDALGAIAVKLRPRVLPVTRKRSGGGHGSPRVPELRIVKASDVLSHDR